MLAPLRRRQIACESGLRLPNQILRSPQPNSRSFILAGGRKKLSIRAKANIENGLRVTHVFSWAVAISMTRAVLSDPASARWLPSFVKATSLTLPVWGKYAAGSAFSLPSEFTRHNCTPPYPARGAATTLVLSSSMSRETSAGSAHPRHEPSRYLLLPRDTVRLG